MTYRPGKGHGGRGPLDRTLLSVVLLLLGFGTVMVYSASSAHAAAAYGDAAYFLKRHLVRAGLGLGLLILFANIRYARFLRLGRPLLLGAIAALVLVLLPDLGGTAAKGAHRWLSVGPFTFQPSDLARFALLLWLAETLATRESVLGDLRSGLLPILTPISAALLLVLLEPDFSTAMVLLVICSAVLFVGGIRVVHLAALLLAAIPAALAFLMTSAYRWQRILAYLDAGSDLHGANWQVSQSLIGLGNGGILGLGLGNSAQKLRFLPEPYNDFIFSVVGEELGLVGALALLLLFGVLVQRGLKIALRAPDRAGALLAFGITFSFGLYVLVNIGVVTSTLPATGLTLPLISYGGSSLLFNMALLGLLLAVSRQVDLEAPE